MPNEDVTLGWKEISILIPAQISGIPVLLLQLVLSVDGGTQHAKETLPQKLMYILVIMIEELKSVSVKSIFKYRMLISLEY